tara:strand:+ start:236 stop:436 length:201 start_codon:yes stop_codon:yes gene_type:complete
MKQLKEENMTGYFKSIALSSSFIFNRVKEIKNGRPPCGCGGCHECYYMYLLKKIGDNFTNPSGSAK